MSINILTFVCGVGVGFCLAFLLQAALIARRAYRFATSAEAHRWRQTQPGKRNDEPTELDQ
jgi:MFS superfamily sulfate permease-like transporter